MLEKEIFHKVLILHFITGLQSGGAEYNLSKLVKETTHEHVVISLTKGGKYRKIFMQRGIMLIDFSLFDLANRQSELRQLILKADLIMSWLHHADFVVSFIKMLNKHIPIVWNIRNDVINFRNGWILPIIFKINIKLSRFVPDVICFNSKAAIKGYDKIGYPKYKFCFIPNGINYKNKIFSYNRTNQFTIGIIGRWDNIKNYSYAFDIIKAFSESVNLKVILVGLNMTPQNEELKSMLLSYGFDKNFTLKGEVSNLSKVYRSIDVLLSPSLSEGFSNVLLEATAYGVPTIATNVGDNELILKNIGKIIKFNDTQKAVSELMRLNAKYIKFDEWMEYRRKISKKANGRFSEKNFFVAYENLWSKFQK